METPETITASCFFCAKPMLIAKTAIAPSLYCADCLSKHRSGVNLSDIKLQRELKENDKRVVQLSFRTM